jgi:hypothetical protein
VYYSPDSGTHWDAVAMAITDTQVTVPSNNLMGSSSGLFRIEASDGIHTTSDTSDAVFTIPNHLPTVTIFTPETDVTIAVSQTLALEAFAYDAELGSMDDDLVWSSSLDGVLGNGSQLSTAVLSAGVHLVTIQANDGQGGSASESVTVTVVATPDDLPPTPDALLVAPHVITLYSAGGLVTTTLGIDNQNPLHDIIWQATVDQPWLSLNISAGTTFTAITLQANAAGLAPGTYQATLTISSTENSSLEVVVPLTLIVEPYINYLPAVTR